MTLQVNVLGQSTSSEGDEQTMVTTPTRQRAGSAADRNRDLTTAMQWEIFSEEGRPLLWSHMVSSALGLTFLLLAVFGPRTIVDTTGRQQSDGFKVAVDMSRILPEARMAEGTRSDDAGRAAGSAGKRGSTTSPSRAQDTQSGIAAAFRAATGFDPGGMVGANAGVLRGVQTSSGSGHKGLASIGSSGQGDKEALSYGGSGSAGSGRVGIGGGAGDGTGRGIGRVNGGGGVTRSVVTISAPIVVAEKLGAPGRDVSQLGTIVRDRQAVVQSCYTQEGLAVNPKLAGTVEVAITLSGGGNVTRVDARPRSMSGPGTAQVMSCIESKIGQWKFPASEAGSGTYSFPFSFTS